MASPGAAEDLRGLAHPLAGPDDPRVPPELRAPEDILEVNFGPNHPSTHGVLRLVVELHGERVVGMSAVIGYLHTGFEKNMEAKSWWKAITYPPRIDYLSFQNNELVFVLGIEKLLGLEVPAKATWMRMLPRRAEPDPLASGLAATAALELGAISMFWYCFRERDQILDLFEMVTGSACTRATTRWAGSPRTSRPGSSPRRASSSSGCRRRSASTSRSSTGTRSGSSGRRGSGCSRPRTRSRSASRARCCGPRAWTGTCASRSRTSPTTRSTSTCPSTKRRRLGPLQGAHGRDAASRPASSPSASTGQGWRASRGSPTTARSCCRRARSSTPRWSR